MDLAFLEGYTQGDRATTLEILRDFRDTTRVDIAGLRPAADRSGMVDLMRGAHRIKGASAMVGARALSEAAESLEAKARAGEALPAFEALAAVESAFAQVDRFTAQEIEKG